MLRYFGHDNRSRHGKKIMWYSYDVCWALMLTWINRTLIEQPPVLLRREKFSGSFTLDTARAQKILRHR
jgi:hypothetical protein